MTARPEQFADPFGTADLRTSTLEGWRSSPTRLREDLATERDLVTVGYRDRLLTELAANAADAAAAAGEPGELAIWADGGEIHIANTGVPLSEDGVRSLAALRVSAKSSDDPHAIVGRFGVGFSVTATVAHRVEIRSRSGSIAFDRAASRDAAAAAGIGSIDVPLLRLPWPIEAAPVAEFDTEIVLVLEDAAAVAAAMDRMRDQLPDLLLELTALHRTRIDGREIGIDRQRRPAGETSGAADGAAVLWNITIDDTDDTDGPPRQWLESQRSGTRWLAELDPEGGVLVPRSDVLRAPTPTDIELGLPARCITELPLTSDRRNLHPEADIRTAAAGYADLVAGVRADQRPVLIPEPGLARNAADARLTEAVLARIADARWVPAASGGLLTAGRTVILADLTEAAAGVLGEVMGDLADPEVSGREQLSRMRRAGAEEIGFADLAERLTGVERDPVWWGRLYAALDPMLQSQSLVDELGALPIPRADGRMSIGARGLYLTDLEGLSVSWIPAVADAAHHPLVERMGAQRISASEILADERLRAALESADDADDVVEELTREVLGVMAVDTEVALPNRLSGLLLLRDDSAELRPADELLLPGGPLAGVLVADSPFGTVAASVVDDAGTQVLRRVGVGWGFTLVTDDLPVAPDHDLPDEDAWWDSLPEPPESLVAVRDLDLVDDDRWRAALTLLAEDPDIAPLLMDRSGYTAWWLRHNAIIDGRRLGAWRAPSEDALLEVLDPLDHPHADALAGALAAVAIESVADAVERLETLADTAREITPGVAVGVHAALVDAVRAGIVHPADIEPPQRVRTSGGTAEGDVVVIDRPWYVQVMDAGEFAVAGAPVTAEDAADLADLLDISLASEAVTVSVDEPGQPVTATSADAVRFAIERDLSLGHGDLRVHDELWITLSRRGESIRHRVRWWIDESGITHVER
ncbi:sacsin N-terminal ATP-binding-like domain-containing protein [Gordonia soli]|uniref:ATP-binding protein n=1 Tax=Gordonia soli NBRC 108243 TaxID=1223545 RepID=M0QLQ0_9ACTN|nr:hypothetical protein [Gordonia soli]GAC68322.1 hypothetical protein GS4_14_01550 [Gordonia soli NBRC 108243]